MAEFKEFKRWFKFKPRLKYGWFHYKLDLKVKGHHCEFDKTLVIIKWRV